MWFKISSNGIVTSWYFIKCWFKLLKQTIMSTISVSPLTFTSLMFLRYNVNPFSDVKKSYDSHSLQFALHQRICKSEHQRDVWRKSCVHGGTLLTAFNFISYYMTFLCQWEWKHHFPHRKSVSDWSIQLNRRERSEKLLTILLDDMAIKMQSKNATSSLSLMKLIGVYLVTGIQENFCQGMETWWINFQFFSLLFKNFKLNH